MSLDKLLALLAESKREHDHCDDCWYCRRACCRACRHPDHGLYEGEHLGEGYETDTRPGAGVCTVQWAAKPAPRTPFALVCRMRCEGANCCSRGAVPLERPSGVMWAVLFADVPPGLVHQEPVQDVRVDTVPWVGVIRCGKGRISPILTGTFGSPRNSPEIPGGSEGEQGPAAPPVEGGACAPCALVDSHPARV